MEILGIVNLSEWLLVGLGLIFGVGFALHTYFSWNYGTLESLGVPCPRPLPFFGNSFYEFFSVIQDLDVENSKKYGRVYGFYESRRPTLRVTDPVILREVMAKQFDNFKYRRHFNPESIDPVVAKMLSYLLGGENWNLMRTVTTPAFTGGKLKKMLSLMENCSQQLVNTLTEKATIGESVEAKQLFIPYLLDTIRSCAFGIEMNSASEKNKDTFDKHAKQLAYSRKIFAIFLTMTLPKNLQKLFNITLFEKNALAYLKKLLEAVIRTRQSGIERRNDFLQAMVDAVKDSEENKQIRDAEGQVQKIGDHEVITQEDIMAQSLLFVVAGFETTARTLSYASYFAVLNEDYQDKLIEEIDRVLEEHDNNVTYEAISKMKYLDMYLNETLRIYPPVIRIDRECSCDTMVGSLKIPKGVLVNIPVYALHHDEEFYPDPERFDPERFSPEQKEQRNPYTYMTFGAGPRSCIGMRFTLLQVKLALINVLRNFRLKRAPETQVPLVFKKASFPMIPVEGIYIKVEERFKS